MTDSSIRRISIKSSATPYSGECAVPHRRHILDKQNGKFTTYLNFNGRNGQPGLFRRLR
jgi:hypothetical protein